MYSVGSVAPTYGPSLIRPRTLAKGARDRALAYRLAIEKTPRGAGRPPALVFCVRAICIADTICKADTLPGSS